VCLRLWTGRAGEWNSGRVSRRLVPGESVNVFARSLAEAAGTPVGDQHRHTTSSVNSKRGRCEP